MIVLTGRIQFKPVRYPEAVETAVMNGLFVDTEGSPDKSPLIVLNIKSMSAETIIL